MKLGKFKKKGSLKIFENLKMHNFIRVKLSLFSYPCSNNPGLLSEKSELEATGPCVNDKQF